MGMMDPQELAAVKRVVAGDTDAFRVLVELHSRSIFKLAYRIMGNEQDADDVVQETFLRAYRKLKDFQFEAALRTWLSRIASNYCMDLLAKRRQQTMIALPDSEFGSIAADLAHPSPDPERLAQSCETKRTVEAAMKSLTATERTAFVMRHFDGCSIRDISEALNLSDTSAKQHVFRAVRKIRVAVGGLMTGAVR
jgi:RNA polymerase sigma-70 factor, ECF subfamily